MADEQKIDVSRRSVIVKMLADVASQGTYNGITPVAARNMNTVFDLAAGLINEMEAEENAAEAVLQAQAAQAIDDEESE